MDLQEDNTHLSRAMDNLSSTLLNRYVLLYWIRGDYGQRRIEAVIVRLHAAGSAVAP